ncbi:MAG TPA: nickel-binding protein [Tepidiformaceae bacterium]|nr:nickel-binding protein [Tepidiformaceae bacterium]
MPLFVIRRRLEGHSESELDAAMFRSLVCTNAFSDMRWVRTFWNAEREESLCVYDAACMDDLREFTQMANIPCDEIWEVAELTPEVYWASHANPAPAIAS